MSRRYLVLKYDAQGERLPIDSFEAASAEEANEAVNWMRKRHPERADLRLGPGEFFEVLEEDQTPPEVWRETLAELARRRQSGGSGAGEG